MPPPPALILASTSRYRRDLLARLGVAFTAVSPACDEEALKRPELGPRELAEMLALAKAESLRREHPDAVIIGSDQVVALGASILGKSGTIERAREQLAALAGRDHQLITSVAVIHGARTWTHTDVTRLTMRPLTTEQIARYVAADRPIDCAGSYKLECRGIALFSRIESEDQTAIVGLPLIAVTGILSDIGYLIP